MTLPSNGKKLTENEKESMEMSDIYSTVKSIPQEFKKFNMAFVGKK